MHRVGVIGVGDFGSFVLKVFESLEDFELYAVSDIVPVKRPEGVLLYRNYRELLDDPKIDVVYIATENFNHAAMAIQALESGKAVLCEKPLFINKKELQHLEAVIAKNKKPFKANFVLPNSNLYQKVLKIARSGELGKLLYVRVENFADESHTQKSWYHNDAKSGGWFATSDIHFLNLVSRLTEEKLELMDVIKYSTGKRMISTCCYLNLGDVPVVLYHNLNSTSKTGCLVKLYFENGYVNVTGWVPRRLTVKTNTLLETYEELGSEQEIYLRLIAENFRNMFEDRSKLEDDLEIAIESNLLALEANEPTSRYRII